MSFMDRLTRGFSAFREAFQHADDPRAGSALVGAEIYNTWERFEARSLRYDVNWAFWQNDAYRRIHTWSKKYKTDYGMYRHSRHIYNPARRIAEFFVCHIYNGAIDTDAGDGSDQPSAIPITIDDSASDRAGKVVRSGLQQLWRDSCWQAEKAIWVRNGATMGDAPLAIVDVPATETQRGFIKLKPLHPRTIKWYQTDEAGHVIAYIREEMRYDPRQLDAARNTLWGVDPLDKIRPVVFTEECELIPGGGVQYRTYLNWSPYDWNAKSPKGVTEWVMPYPAVPLVMTQHIPIGSNYGMGEYHADQPKIREVDDIASKLDDHIRKLVDIPWLFAGVKKADLDLGKSADQPTWQNPEADRQQMKAIYATDASAKGQALVADVKVEEVTKAITGMLDEIERDHPEIRFDRLSATGPLSGTALRTARQPAETKVQERRATYDHDLARIQELALCIGGIQGYPGYVSASMNDYANGRFAHSIAQRPVFAVDHIDRLEEDAAESGSIKGWVDAGVPLSIALRKAGWSDADIKEIEDKKAKDAAAAVAQQPQPDTPNPIGFHANAKPNERPTNASPTAQPDAS